MMSNLAQEYRVERADGTVLGRSGYIVLEMADPRAWPALLTWADTVEAEGNARLASRIRWRLRQAQWVAEESARIDAELDLRFPAPPP